MAIKDFIYDSFSNKFYLAIERHGKNPNNGAINRTQIFLYSSDDGISFNKIYTILDSGITYSTYSA